MTGPVLAAAGLTIGVIGCALLIAQSVVHDSVQYPGGEPWNKRLRVWERVAWSTVAFGIVLMMVVGLVYVWQGVL